MAEPAKSRRAITPERARLAELLAKYRQKRGYQTAYAFFHKNGGAKAFGFSYHHYLLVEKGARLPSRESFKVILDLLGSKHFHYDTWLETVRTYMKAVLGGDDFFGPLFETPKKPAELPPDRRGARKASGVPALTEEQQRVVLSGPECFWAHQWLLQTGQKKSAAELARDLRLSEASVNGALAQLVASALVEKAKDRYASPFFETGQDDGPSLAKGGQLWISEQISQVVERDGNEMHYLRYLFALEDPEHLQSITAMMQEFMKKVLQFRATAPVDKGWLVSVESRVSRLLPIGE